MAETLCPIWGTKATLVKSEPASDGPIKYYDSAKAVGKYAIDARGRAVIENRKKGKDWSDGHSKALTRWLKKARTKGYEFPLINAERINAEVGPARPLDI